MKLREIEPRLRDSADAVAVLNAFIRLHNVGAWYGTEERKDLRATIVVAADAAGIPMDAYLPDCGFYGQRWPKGISERAMMQVDTLAECKLRLAEIEGGL